MIDAVQEGASSYEKMAGLSPGAKPALEYGSDRTAYAPVKPASAILLFRPGIRAQRMLEIDHPSKNSS